MPDGGDPRARFDQHVVDHIADLVADQLGQQPVGVDFGVERADLGPAPRDQGHGEQFFEAEQAGAQAVVDVVIVVGDVVGDRGDLRLEARPARQIEREFGIDRLAAPSPARRPGHYAWRALRASPS